MNVIVAASTQMAADAGAEVASEGGNAVDAAISAALVSMCTDVTAVSMGASGFLTIAPPGHESVVIDAHAEVPGRGLSASDEVVPGREVEIGYGGGMRTIVGYGSVATPGALAGLALASKHWGRLPWKRLVEPSIRLARDGFPLPHAEDEYLGLTRDSIFGWQPESRQALHHEDGRPVRAAELLKIPGLARTLEQIAHEGAGCFYDGEIGRQIADHVHSHGGRLTRQDMAEYEPICRTPLRFELDGWEVVTNPPPAVGGSGLAALLLLLSRSSWEGWGSRELRQLIEAQETVRSYRRNHLDVRCDRSESVQRMLDAARAGSLHKLLSSPSTAHTSAVDTGGTGCAITLSIGYGSGVLIPGTGVWLNNALGEIDLKTPGSPPPVGTRLLSNMAPTVARSADGLTLAIGASGAERITTAIAQVLLHFLWRGLSFADATAHPRLHVEGTAPDFRIAHEPGLSIEPGTARPTRPFPDRDMFFGTVQAALWQPDAGLFAGVDPRRDGAAARGGTG